MQTPHYRLKNTRSGKNSLSSRIRPVAFMRHFYDASFFMERAHKHINLELIYIARGIMEVEYGSNGQSCYLNSDRFAVIRPNRPHRLISRSDDVELLEFELTPCDENVSMVDYLQDCAEFAAYPSLAALLNSKEDILAFSDTTTVKQHFVHLLELLKAHENNRQDEFFELDYEVTLKQLLLAVCRCNTPYFAVRSNRYINQCLTFIQEKYAENITVPIIAGYLKLSPSYIQRMFKSALGMSVMEAVNLQRLKHAENLLLNTDLTVRKIALRSGFHTQNVLYKHFSAKHGCSPTCWRSHNKSEAFEFF